MRSCNEVDDAYMRIYNTYKEQTYPAWLLRPAVHTLCNGANPAAGGDAGAAIPARCWCKNALAVRPQVGSMRMLYAS